MRSYFDGVFIVFTCWKNGQRLVCKGLAQFASCNLLMLMFSPPGLREIPSMMPDAFFCGQCSFLEQSPNTGIEEEPEEFVEYAMMA